MCSLHMRNNNGLGTLSILSYGKTNLTLRITGTMPDGYHQVFTLMAKVDIYDHISIAPLPSGNTKDIVVFNASGKHIDKEDVASLNAMESLGDSSGGTSVSKIVNLLRKEYGEIMGLTNQFFHIIVSKYIPQGSGMGGSSSNAHATLVGIMSLVSSSLSYSSKHRLLKKIGADAPFFLHQKPQICHGRGDEFLSSADLPQGVSLVVIFPHTSNATAEIYAEYARQQVGKEYSPVPSGGVFEGMPRSRAIDNLQKGSTGTGSLAPINVECQHNVNIEAEDLALLMNNDLLPAALNVNKELKELYSILFTKVQSYNTAHGETLATTILNGSGSSVSVVCFNKKSAQYFTASLTKLFPYYYVGCHTLVQDAAKVHTLQQGSR